MVLSGMSENDIRLNKASTRLYKQVNRMICKMDHIISDLEKKGHDLKLKIKNGDGHQEKEQ